MQNDLNPAEMDLTQAIRDAERRGQAIRAEETRALFAAIAGMVRDLFSAPTLAKTKDA